MDSSIISSLITAVSTVIIATGAIIAALITANNYIKQKQLEQSSETSKHLSAFISNYSNQDYNTLQNYLHSYYKALYNLINNNNINKSSDLSQLLAIARFKYIFIYHASYKHGIIDDLRLSIMASPYSKKVMKRLEKTKYKKQLLSILYSFTIKDNGNELEYSNDYKSTKTAVILFSSLGLGTGINTKYAKR